MTRIANTPVVLIRYELRCGYVRCEQIAEQLHVHLTGDPGLCEAKDVSTGFDHPLAVLEVAYTSIEHAVRLDFSVRDFIKRFAGKRRRFCVGCKHRLPIWEGKSRRWFETKAQAMQFLETLPEANVAAGQYYVDEM